MEIYAQVVYPFFYILRLAYHQLRKDILRAAAICTSSELFKLKGGQGSWKINFYKRCGIICWKMLACFFIEVSQEFGYQNGFFLKIKMRIHICKQKTRYSNHVYVAGCR